MIFKYFLKPNFWPKRPKDSPRLVGSNEGPMTLCSKRNPIVLSFSFRFHGLDFHCPVLLKLHFPWSLRLFTEISMFSFSSPKFLSISLHFDLFVVKFFTLNA